MAIKKKIKKARNWTRTIFLIAAGFLVSFGFYAIIKQLISDGLLIFNIINPYAVAGVVMGLGVIILLFLGVKPQKIKP